MAKTIENGVLKADGVLDNVAAQLSVLNPDVETVEKSVWYTGIILGATLGFCGGVAAESRGVTVPFISPMFRPKAKKLSI
jgi:hypothetical protein